METTLFLILCTVGIALAQRPSYAGRLPYGYPEIEDTPAEVPDARATAFASANSFRPIDDRFTAGEPADAPPGPFANQPAPQALPTTTPRLPIEANGDLNLIQRLSKLPEDRQPFWYLNWRALEEHRSKPASYSLPRNNFIHRVSSNNGNTWS